MDAIFFRIAPKWSSLKADWFWSPYFKMELTHEWWLKFIGDYLLNIISYYILAKVAAKFSNVLFIICVIFFGYHCIDFIMFMWDYNGQLYIYLDLGYTSIILIKYAIFPYKEERFARIKSLF